MVKLDLNLVKKVDYKEFDKINISLSKKLDMETLNNSIFGLKGDFKDGLERLRQDTSLGRKYLEEKIQEKLVYLQKNIEKAHENFTKVKDITDDLYIKRDSDQHEIVNIFDEGYIS